MNANSEVSTMARTVIKAILDVATDYELLINTNSVWGHKVSIKKKEGWD